MDKSLEVNPKEPQAWAFKGDYALRKGNNAQADSFFTKAANLNQNDYQIFLARAQARYSMNKFGGALADYDKVIELVPEHFVAHYNRGLLRAQVGDDNRAIDDFDFVIRTEPDNILAIYNRALLRERTGNLRGAISDYTRILRAYPNFTYGYATRAKLRRKIGDFKGAVADETKVYKSDLDLMFGSARRTNIKKVRKRSEHSLDQYKQLVEEDPDTSKVYINDMFGKVQNRKVEVAPIYMFALRIGIPSDKDYNQTAFVPQIDQIGKKTNLKNRLLLTSYDDRLAMGATEADLSSISKSGKDDSGEKIVKSALQRELYNYADALKELSAISDDDSLAFLSNLQRSVLFYENAMTQAGSTETFREDMIKQSLAQIDKAIAKKPQIAALYYNKAFILYGLKNYRACIEELNKAVKINNRFAEAFFNRALAYKALKEYDKAESDLSKSGEMGIYKAYSILKSIRGENND